MSGNLLKIQRAYLKELYDHLPQEMEQMLPASRENDIFSFRAFGECCEIRPDGITLAGEVITGPEGILIALYARNARKEPAQLEPFKSFRDLKGSMPYQGAFALRAESSLVPYVKHIQQSKKRVIESFDGHENGGLGGDFSCILFPLPKIPLCYVFYASNEEFPATVTCLFGANAEAFMPVDGLADVAEHTATKIIKLITSER
ncbi:MAG: DUF3786 domain-containing protein [Deltaproteobacteria bacterium]|nr:MAG: DUF3786 domain-containing protein [Deltaproteobacteria bacterium]